jgi:VWFA-related protein
MRLRTWCRAFGIVSLCLLPAIFLLRSTSAQVLRGGPNCGAAIGPGCAPTVSAPEQAAYDAFTKEPTVDTKIALGEQFDQKYPKSRYQEQVDTQLAFLYFNKGDNAKFYAAADRALATNPKSVPMLELVGWVIPRDYSAKAPDAAAKLDEAEKYEKRALAIVTGMKKPRRVTQAQFEESQASQLWRAHSGLGMVYFRRKDYADSASELQSSIKQQGSQPDPTDLYVLGLDLENLGKTSQGADEFAQCAASANSIRQDCQKAYEQASHAVAESTEEKAYQAFSNAPNADLQIQLGEKFDQTYSSSPYEESVESTLAALYADKQDWAKFYAAIGNVLAKHPDNVSVLALAAWTIPREENPDQPNAAARLDQAEAYAKHALELIPTMPKPSDLTADEFDEAKRMTAARAHSGLGAVYFRRGDFADSAQELTLAKSSGAALDAFDYYVLGIDLAKLNKDSDAAAAFANCAAIPGSLQAQCKRDAELRSQQNAKLAVVATRSTAPPAPAAADIPPASSQEAAPAIKTETIIVPVRVVVRDNRGRALANLKKENFKLYQDGRLQEIANFTAVAAPHPGGSTVPGRPSTSAPGTGSGSGNSDGGKDRTASRFIVLFFDDVHFYFADMAQLRTAAEKYLSSVRPQDRVAVVTASGKGDADFTSDRDKLHATIAKLMPHPFPGGSMAPAPTANCPPPMTYTEADAIVEQRSQGVLDMAAGDFAVCDHLQFEDPNAGRGAAEAAAQAAAEYTRVAGENAVNAVLARLEGAVRHLAAMPGQRDIVLISPGFMYGKHAEKFAGITNLAIRDNVVINALDAKGIYAGDGKWDPDRFFRQGYGHNVELPVLQDLADGTGGIFIHYNNDYVGSLREMSEPPEAYYLLGYAPQNLQPDGKFHVLKVSLTSGAHGNVQARRGFFAPSQLETPEEKAKREIDDAAYSDEQQNDLPMRLETHLNRDAAGTEKLNVKAHFDTSRLRFEKAGAKNDENLIVTAVLFDKDGNYVEGSQQTANMDLDDAAFSQMQKSGFFVEVDLNVKPGDYVLRTVVRDSNDGHISAESTNISVPN